MSGSAYSLLRRLGDGPEDQQKFRSFSLPEWKDKEIPAQECPDMLADHFSKLSLTLEPISMKNFHPKFRKTIKEGIQDKDKPVLNEYEVYRKLKQAKKPNSSVPGDIPKPILKEFTPEFAFPVTKIFNKITKSACYPRDWVREYQTPIPKIPSP